MKDDCPCIECDRRSAECHAECVAYREWAAAKKKAKWDAWAALSGRREAKERYIDKCIAHKRRIGK